MVGFCAKGVPTQNFWSGMKFVCVYMRICLSTQNQKIENSLSCVKQKTAKQKPNLYNRAAAV